jgi:putative tricarboxylic transport membrane protein
MMRGFDLIGICVGLFGIGEVLQSLEQGVVQIYEGKLGKMMPRDKDLKNGLKGAARGTLIGYFLGLLPGIVAPVTTFISYDVEKRMSKHPEKFGKGAIEGVAGPEAANNAASEGALVPLLALGVPTGPVPAVLLAALMVHGITPGPLFIKEQPQVFWGLIASMYVGNLVLLLLNLPMVSIFVNLLRVPYRILYPTILLFCVVGVYAVNSSMVDVGIMSVMGVLGYLLRKMDFETAPMVLGVVLAPIIEFSFRQALAMSDGAYSIFVQRPIAGFFLAIALIMVLLGLKPLFIKKKDWRDRLTDAEKST